MDAISFVLGVKGGQLRGQLHELLYSAGEASPDERAKRALVQLTYQPDGECSAEVMVLVG
jgi:hypothetical protein